MENKIDNEKRKVKRELISDDLSMYLIVLLTVYIICAIFGFIGYKISLETDIPIKNGIVFGAIFPFGIILIKAFCDDKKFAYLIYTIVYLLVVEHLNYIIGVIILLIIVIAFIGCFIYIEFKNRNNEVETIARNRIHNSTLNTEIRQVKNYNDYYNNYSTKKETPKVEQVKYNNIYSNNNSIKIETLRVNNPSNTTIKKEAPKTEQKNRVNYYNNSYLQQKTIRRNTYYEDNIRYRRIEVGDVFELENTDSNEVMRYRIIEATFTYKPVNMLKGKKLKGRKAYKKVYNYEKKENEIVEHCELAKKVLNKRIGDTIVLKDENSNECIYKIKNIDKKKLYV